MHVRRENCVEFGVAIVVALLMSVLPSLSTAAELIDLPNGSKLDLSHKCPVCGMVVGGEEAQGVTVTFKDGRMVGFAGVAAAVFRDGHVVGFEGARCLFIYNSVPQKYDVDIANITHQFVTDFTSKKLVDLSKAFLVLGSSVKGPMGYELIPFTTKEEAVKFAGDNHGKWIVQLHPVVEPRTDGPRTQKVGKPGEETPGAATGQRPDPPVVKEEEVSPEQIDTETKKKTRSRTSPKDEGRPRPRGGGHHMH